MSLYEYILPSQFEQIGFKQSSRRMFTIEIDGVDLLLHVTDEHTHYALSLLDTIEFKLVELPFKLKSFVLIEEVTKALTPSAAWEIHKKLRSTFAAP